MTFFRRSPRLAKAPGTRVHVTRRQSVAARTQKGLRSRSAVMIASGEKRGQISGEEQKVVMPEARVWRSW